MPLTNYAIVLPKPDGSVVTCYPSQSAERDGMTPEEVAVLSIPELREQLDRVMLGVDALDKLVGTKEETIQVDEEQTVKINGKKSTLLRR